MAGPRKTLIVRVARQLKRPTSSEEETLGRNLAAAYISMQQGIGMDYAKKRHTTDDWSPAFGSLWRAW